MEANIVSIHSEDLLKTFMVEMQGPFCPTTARQSVVNSRAKLHDISEISSLFHGNHRRPPKLFTQLLRMIDALIPLTSLAKCWFSIGLFGLIEGMYWLYTTFLRTIDLYHLQRNNRNARNLLPEIILGTLCRLIGTFFLSLQAQISCSRSLRAFARSNCCCSVCARNGRAYSDVPRATLWRLRGSGAPMSWCSHASALLSLLSSFILFYVYG